MAVLLAFAAVGLCNVFCPNELPWPVAPTLPTKFDIVGSEGIRVPLASQCDVKFANEPSEQESESDSDEAILADVDLPKSVSVEPDTVALERKMADATFASVEFLSKRKHLDMARWRCISRPQYRYSCGLSSLVGCWNFLYSTLGHGDCRPITQEEALQILGFSPPFSEIRFGPFTGNQTLMRWFAKLNAHAGVLGKAYYFWKAHGVGRTVGVTSDRARSDLIEQLRLPEIAFIYHCWNHYFVVIGSEISSNVASDAYVAEVPSENAETWIMFGDTSRTSFNVRCCKWEWIDADISSQAPFKFDLRNPQKGLQERRKSRKVGGNLHCIMAFRKETSHFQPLYD